jgi:hypothetical protein
MVAQALPVQGAPAAQSAQGRNIQQYFVLAGTRPPSADSARVVPLNPPAGTVRVGQAAANGSGASAQDARTPPGAAPNPASAGDPNDHSWFAAAMLHGVERYRDTRRSQDGAPPSVDRTE